MQRWPPDAAALQAPGDALERGQRAQEQAAQLGFDWPDTAPVWAKLAEEIAELQLAAESGNIAEIRHELGDVLFSVVNLARFLDVDAQGCMDEANRRFSARLSAIQSQLERMGRRWDECSLHELEELWQQVKREA